MEILSWNIQSGRGVDGQLDLTRITADIQDFSRPDVICLQEVVRHCPELDDGQGADQARILAELFPGFTPIFGPAFDRSGGPGGGRRQYGNMLLSRLPLDQVFHHVLPNPAEPDRPQMPRQAIEVVVESEGLALRLITTHLAYHALGQRRAQLRRLRELTAEVAGQLRAPPADRPNSPFERAQHPVTTVFCGDFNLLPDSPEYQEMTAPFEDGTPAIRDAWCLLYGERPHEPSCGLFDREQWGEGPHCRDFFFVTEDLSDRLLAVEVNQTSAASDHQPLKLNLRT